MKKDIPIKMSSTTTLHNMKKIILIVVLVVILTTPVITTEAWAQEPLCPDTNHSRYCLGFNNGQMVKTDPIVPCGKTLCFTTCNVGDHSKYCIGYNQGAYNRTTPPCPAGNITRYCIGWMDGSLQAELDHADGWKHNHYKCLVGHTLEYCNGYSYGYSDMTDFVRD